MIRTLVISQYYPPESLGGAHRWKEIVESLPEDHKCRIVSPPPSFPHGEFGRSWKPIERDNIDGIAVTRLWTYQPQSDATSEESNLGRILNYILFSIFGSLYVFGNFWRYENIVTVSAPHTTFLPGVIGNLLGLSWFPDIFDLWLDNALDLGYVERDTLPYQYISALEKKAICQSDNVFVITETMAEHYVDKYDVPLEQFTIVPFGVNENMFNSEESPNSKEIVYTGNMGEAHALKPFILAFEQLEGVAELRLIGTGKRREELEQLCNEAGLTDTVTFEGVVPREDIPDILSGAWASIVPLKQGYNLDYARPTKLLESMAVGTPYIASRLREIERITEDSGAGYAVNNDSDEIAVAIKKLVGNNELHQEMGQRGVEFIDQEHRWPEIAARVDETIRKRANLERQESR